MNHAKQEAQIETLEHAFWQSLVDDDSGAATDILATKALMVSGHGAMSFDHAGYTKMAKDPKHKLLSFELSKMEVLFPTEDVAIATYHVHQKMELEGKPAEMQAVDSSTWVKVGDEWKCAAHTESLQPPKK